MLKNIFAKVLFLLCLSGPSWAHDGHAQHNMVLFGETEIFASHIVYKVPHHYQVILALSLSAEDREKYLAAKREQPTAQFIYLLDHMDISKIAAQEEISGTVFYKGSDGIQQEVIANMRVSKGSFKIIYFNELPLSLEAGPRRASPCEGENKCPSSCPPGQMCINGRCLHVF